MLTATRPKLNSPNDLVGRANGDLYFTDPSFGLPGTFAAPPHIAANHWILRLRTRSSTRISPPRARTREG